MEERFIPSGGPGVSWVERRNTDVSDSTPLIHRLCDGPQKMALEKQCAWAAQWANVPCGAEVSFVDVDVM